MKKVLIYLFCLMPFMASAIGDYGVGSTLYVLAPSGVRMRDKPNGDKILSTIGYGTAIVVQEQKLRTNAFESEGIKGYWVKVILDKQIGWVFDGFLSNLKAPDKSVTSIAEYVKKYCKSTTPRLYVEKGFDGDEGGNDVYMQIWQQGKRSLVYTEHGYYEGYADVLAIPDASVEEGWLLAKQIFKARFEESIKNVKENPEPYVDGEGKLPTLDQFEKFNPDERNNIRVTLATLGIFEEILITYDEETRTVFIEIGGGA